MALAFWGSLLWASLAPSRCPADANSGAENAIGQNSFGGLGTYFYRLGLGSTSLGRRPAAAAADARAECFGARCFGRRRCNPFGAAKEIVTLPRARTTAREVNMRLPTLLPSALIAVLIVLTSTGPAWAGRIVPGPAAGGLAGEAIIGALVIAKLWRRKKPRERRIRRSLC